ncbi:hypothetical protein [uncultured Eubacterium sp.]|uniref:hypothetical protein n=1 Tax=uncultured Eubacterium sp. TaxID=165185 RepID=UPI0025DE17BA|nr:hypothetical protein [uncultured Eubacterium sp.]
MKTDFASRRKARTLLSFVLYLCIVMCALCFEFMFVTANPKTFVYEFTNSTYVENLRCDIAQYTKDLCAVNSISDDFVDNLITYDNIYKIENAYISTEFVSTQEFSQDAYGGLLDQLKENVATSVANVVKSENLTVEKTVKNTAIDEFADDVADYAGKVIQFGYARQVKDFCDLSKTVCSILIAVCSAIGIGIIISLFKQTSRKYRATRNIAYSLLASVVMNLIVLAAVAIIKATRQLVIYPTYLVDVFIRWLNDSMCALAIGSFVLAVLFAVFACVTWKMKRDSKQ